LILSELDEQPGWRLLAEEALSSIHDLTVSHPLAFSAWLQVADLAVGPVSQAAIVWPEAASFPTALIGLLNQDYRPRMAAALSPYPLKEGFPALLKNRAPVDKLATAFLCHGFVCLRPVTNTNDFARQLAEDSKE
jgi:uncharacterized protein YyaL (SSP411 family)